MSASSASIAGSVSASPRIVNDEVSCPAAAVSDAPIAKISCRIWRLSRRRRAFLHRIGDELRQAGLLRRIDGEA